MQQQKLVTGLLVNVRVLKEDNCLAYYVLQGRDWSVIQIFRQNYICICMWISAYSVRPPLYNDHFCCSNNNNNNNNLYCALDTKSVKTLKGNNCGCFKKIINYQLLYPLLIYKSYFFCSILLPTMYLGPSRWPLWIALNLYVLIQCMSWWFQSEV